MLARPRKTRLDRKLPVIAIVGCDGSGKSTLGRLLVDHYGAHYPTAWQHLGKQGGQILKPFAKIPFLGGKIRARADKQTEKDYANAPIGGGTALISFVLSMRRMLRFLAMRKKMRIGRLIFTDRFPQIERPGPMDGLMLKSRPHKDHAAKFLARLEERIYELMLRTKPDLVIALDVDYETAVKRKPDHRPASLKRKIEDFGEIAYGGAPTLRLNALNSVQDNKRQAIKAVDKVLESYELL